MNNEILVKVEGVSKKFCKDLKTSLKYGVYDLTNEVLGRKHSKEIRPKEFWAINDVSFELRRGEVLGLIGRNGAGKTSLLKILNGLIKPTVGRITMRGRVGALIALGAGFNPILTGRENVYINGAVLGLTKKEINKKFNEIVDFAELWDFIDMPVQSYSSGMHVRLGFAIASTLNPDILIIDEVLAVGDRAFRQKCFNRISEIIANTCVILVSHSMFDISRICNRVILLDKGTIKFDGDTNEGIDQYNNNEHSKSQIQSIPEIRVISISLNTVAINYGEGIGVKVIFESKNIYNNLFVRMMFTDPGEATVGEWRSDNYGLFYDIIKGNNELNFEIKDIRLRHGSYNLNFILTGGVDRPYIITAHQSLKFKMENSIYTSSHYII